MCGITGFISFGQELPKELLQTMNNALAHRGPDAEGFFYKETLGLGHRRLSILDLSEQANQPMFSHNGRYVIVFNGEIYNFQEVAEKLHIQMRTHSDTEVILEAFAQKGVACVQLFNGMFAFAIYDTQENELYLFRDRIGKKPLYYFWNGQYFAFASELKALQHLPFIKKDLNEKAIRSFLHLGYIPRPDTIYEHISKMYSGYWLKVTKDGIEENLYWDIQSVIKPEKNKVEEVEATEQLKTLLQSSVKYRLISDVPLGIFLSGGIDSSLVAAIAQEQSTQKIKTFSIGFEEEKYNEAPFARKVAQALNTEHYEHIISIDEAKKLVPELIGIYDEPYADSSAVPTLLVSEFAKKQVSVVLGGDGGDELFLGYGMYQWAKRLQQPFWRAFRKPMAMLLALRGEHISFKKAASLFNYPSHALASHIFSQEQFFFSQKELDKLLLSSYEHTEILHSCYEDARCDPMQQQALFDLQYYLQDDLMVKVDRATMHYGLEARSPFLDYRLIEFALNLPTELKYKDKESKYLLKKILYQYLPKNLFERPKRGFSIPLADWLSKDLKFMIDEYLNESVVKKHQIVRYEEV
ncbi:MAG: asparagine synthase (glutamine-hydrolyzing), partial [Thermonemataceae bacterium]|nr:asparagine synthase (glutamine-hydrolyzing) [Thermonemataceae bacterium]